MGTLRVAALTSHPVAFLFERMQTIYAEDSDMTHEDLIAFVRKALNENAFFKPIVENQTLVHHVVDHIKPRTVKPGTEIIRKFEYLCFLQSRLKVEVKEKLEMNFIW